MKIPLIKKLKKINAKTSLKIPADNIRVISQEVKDKIMKVVKTNKLKLLLKQLNLDKKEAPE